MTLWANGVEIDDQGRLIVRGSTPINRMDDAQDLLMAYQADEWLSVLHHRGHWQPRNE
jgi:hypothetical protein